MNKQEWLLSQIALFPDLSARELASKLNDKILVSNPQAQQQVPVIATLEEVSVIVRDDEVFEVGETEAYKRIINALEVGNVGWIVGNLTTLKRGGKLSQASFDAIMALFERTEPDPNYQEQVLISPAKSAGFDFVLFDEVEELKLIAITPQP